MTGQHRTPVLPVLILVGLCTVAGVCAGALIWSLLIILGGGIGR